MSDMSELLIGAGLMILSFVWLLVSLPRHGRKAWFVGRPLVDSGIPILMITVFAIGVTLLTAYFTTIDDATLSGIRRQL